MRARILLLAALSAIVVASFAGPTTGCGGKDSSSPGENVCSQVSFSSSGSIGFNMSCSSISNEVRNIRYDQFSRPISYDFSFRCTTGGGTTYAGSVQNIRWDNLGRALGADVTVNGKTCRF